MRVTSLKIVNGQIVGLKGQKNEVVEVIAGSASKTRKAVIEIVDDVPKENLPAIIETLSRLRDYHLILEGGDRRIGFYFLFNGGKAVIFIDRGFLAESDTIKLLEEISQHVSNNEYLQINLLSPMAIISTLDILRNFGPKINRKKLQLDAGLGKFLVENKNLLEVFDSIKVFTSKRHVVIVDNRLKYIKILRPEGQDSTLLLREIINFSQRVPVTIVEIDGSKNAEILAKIITIIQDMDVSPAQCVVISPRKIQLSVAQFCVIVEIEDFSEKKLLNALKTATTSLGAGRFVRISVK